MNWLHMNDNKIKEYKIVKISVPKKHELINECIAILQTPNVAKWYSNVMEKTPQAETIAQLDAAIDLKHLTNKEALAIALVVPAQSFSRFYLAE